MRCQIITAALVLCGGLVFAAESVGTNATSKVIPEEFKKQILEQKMRSLEKTGGKILKPGSQQGSIAFLNAQKSIPLQELQKSLDGIRLLMKHDISLRDAGIEVRSFEDVRSAQKKSGATLAIVIVDTPDFPAMLVAPEERWGLINLGLLRNDNPAPAFLAARVRKEMTRTFAFLCGAASSKYPTSIMGAISTPANLDEYPERNLPIDIVARITPYLKTIGVTPGKYDSYLDACQEGWAPQPTNKYQKAIWDKVHAIPNKPLKIQFDPATQKGKVTK